MVGHKMMVSSPTPLSAQIGKEIIKKKGNVVDVAVGMALVLAVTNPRHAALGGGGFALVKMGKDPVKALDFREVAPAKMGKDFYTKNKKHSSLKGPHAVGVPGIPAGLWALHKKYGKLHWSQLFDRPIELAHKGHHISGENASRLKGIASELNNHGKTHFLINGKPPLPGQWVRQKGLAKALKLMRNRGITPFYEGQISYDITNTLTKAGGVMTRKDLQDYKVRWLEPLTKTFKGHTLYLMPPPSSGGLIISSSLSMFEKLKTTELEPMSTQEVHQFAEVLKINFRNRNLLGDPDFVKNPMDTFTDEKSISEWVKKIEDDEVLELEDVKPQEFKESNQTTHLSVLDAQGNAVSMTLTLNGTFGSKMATEKFGIALNNEMDDFTTRPGKANLFKLKQGLNNLVEPGKRPLSSMSPTLIAKGNEIVGTLGAPGGPRIITGVLMTLYRLLNNDYNIEEAIHAPRVHHQFKPNILYLDEKKWPPLSIKALRKLGHIVEFGWQSRVNGVTRNDEGLLEAAYDFRAEGGADGI
jgi:gamma-glutamyltranspeptidase/glutathione hydrolase